MRKVIAKTWLLLSLLLMPLGMAPAQASAVPHHPPSVMPMQHCPDQPASSHFKGGIAECAMTCSAALPAANAPDPGPRLILCEPAQSVRAQQLEGIEPEIVTPPPKAS